MSTIRITIILIFIQLAGTSLIAVTPNQPFIDKTKWEKLSKKYEYSENYKTREPKKESSKFADFLSSMFKSDHSWIKYAIWGIIVVGLSVLLIFLIVGLYKDNLEKLSLEKLGQNIEDIEHADLDYFLKDALNRGSFKEAIRMRYLMLLKTLNNLQLVTWKKDKTNGKYVSEMFGKVGFDLFRMITLHFERVWYGEKEVNENDYENLIPYFDQINKVFKGETAMNQP